MGGCSSHPCSFPSAFCDYQQAILGAVHWRLELPSSLNRVDPWEGTGVKFSQLLEAGGESGSQSLQCKVAPGHADVWKHGPTSPSHPRQAERINITSPQTDSSSCQQEAWRLVRPGDLQCWAQSQIPAHLTRAAPNAWERAREVLPMVLKALCGWVPLQLPSPTPTSQSTLQATPPPIP